VLKTNKKLLDGLGHIVFGNGISVHGWRQKVVTLPNSLLTMAEACGSLMRS